MPTEHAETELKFDVDDGFALPALDDVDGVAEVAPVGERQLEAIYHDTADLRLARARVTLRRRTGGPDEGWHVKLPVSGRTRRELRFPAGRATRTPPRAVLGPVLGLARTAPVGPVATLNTRRTVTELRDDTGRVLAEIADDTVTGTAPAPVPGEPATVVAWREVEVELVEGDEELLDRVAERFVAAGAHVSSESSKLGRVLADRLAVLTDAHPGQAAVAVADTSGGARKSAKKAKKKRAAVPGVTAGAAVLTALAEQVHALQEADLLVRVDDPEGVHDVRVACRRLRSILAAYRRVLDRERTDPLRDELQWLGQQLSAARDGQVALAHLREMVAAEPVELVLGPVAARLQQAEAKDTEAGRQSAQKAMTDRRYLRLLDSLAELVDTPPLLPAAELPAAGVLADAIRRSGKRLKAATAEARLHPPGGIAAGDALHEVRKAAKRVRYTAEVAVPVLGEPAAALVGTAKEAQEALGDRQDTVVTRDRCRSLGIAAHAAGEIAWTYGRLHALEEARAHAAEARFWELEPGLVAAIDAARRSA